MEGRKWEELPMDCLVNVFGRVGMGSLLLDVPFVSKSWYKATLNPICWKELGFPDISRYSWLSDPFIIRLRCQYRLRAEISTTKFVKAVVDRSAGYATMVKLPSCYTEGTLITYVADKCPALKKLVIHSKESSSMWALASSIRKFKNLESLEIKSDVLFKDFVTEIGSHCENFVSLSLVATSDALSTVAPVSKCEQELLAMLTCLQYTMCSAEKEVYIGEEEVMVLVTCLPKIKCLTLRDVSIKRENLIKILKGCVELVHLDARDCHGFDEDDEEILKLASHIPTFECSGSVFHTFGDDNDDYDYYSSD